MGPFYKSVSTLLSLIVGYATTQGNWKLYFIFFEKEELEENSIYSFLINKKYEIEKHWIKEIILLLVRVKF